MKQWNIPVTWEASATIIVEANTLEEAMEIARDDDAVIPCPTDNEYVGGSWRLSYDDKDFLRTCYNDGQQDDVVDVPTADAQEVKHGKWIHMSDADGHYYCCSVCGENLERIPISPYKIFCPNCGAVIDK